jgi:phenylpropionate dioxygenase-like ring-hydroxylating dioxygenase large terminal subunit
MHSRMPPQAYIDHAWFERERDLLFKPLWQFIGLKMMLAAHNAYITRTLCGIPIVVQNFNGELRAFENICLHRQNPIQTQAQGVRPLVCSYHGWGYGSDGAPANIPFEAALYRFPAEERACLHLRRFALECVGNLVFINLSADPMPIKQQLGAAMINSLAASSEAYDSEVIMTTYDGRFNWKLAYENLRDGHHPRYVHARTLYQDVKFQASIDESGVAALQRLQQAGITDRAHALALLRTFSGGGRDAPMEKVTHEGWHENVERYRDQDWYYNWLVFPNLHIASATGGYSFIIEQHIPVGPNRTEFIVHCVTAKKKRRYASSVSVLHEHMLGADKVLREDIDVMENIQRTLHPGARPAHLGDYEFVNAGIERWYLDVMEGKIAL